MNISLSSNPTGDGRRFYSWCGRVGCKFQALSVWFVYSSE